jgi:hypothetical protein
MLRAPLPIRALHDSILDADTETAENAFADRLSPLNLRLQRNLYMEVKEPGKKDLIATVSLNLGFGVVPLIKVNQ